MTGGRELEQLVKRLEEKLLPAGFSVAANTRVSDAGVQLAEFDLLVQGRLGSSDIRWLIECRDRPSDGAAPVEWIEQLVGRRQRFHFDKVFAVSTTGFSEAAERYASDERIVLRTLTDANEIEGDLSPQRLWTRDLTVEIVGDPLFIAIGRRPPKTARVVDVMDPRSETEFEDLRLWVQRRLRPGPDERESSERDELFRYRGPLAVRFDGKRIMFMGVEVPVRRKLVVTKGATSVRMRVYSGDGRNIGAVGVVEFDTPGGRIAAETTWYRQGDGTDVAEVDEWSLPADKRGIGITLVEAETDASGAAAND